MNKEEDIRFVRAVRRGCTTQICDVNADNSVEVVDAITLLRHLFQSSPSQLPPPCNTQSYASLPDTGQTFCYDAAGNVIECDSDTWPGQDAFYATGCATEERFIDNRDGTITDTCTGLIWQKATADTNGDSELTIDDRATWQEALQFCEDLEFAENSDWRLPNGRELESLVDYGRLYPCMNPIFDTESWLYWSSSTLVGIWGDAGGTESAGFVSFEYGSRIYFKIKTTPLWVRAVRDGP